MKFLNTITNKSKKLVVALLVFALGFSTYAQYGATAKFIATVDYPYIADLDR